MDDILAKIEGLLYVVGDEGLSLEELSDAINVDKMVVQDAIQDLTIQFQGPRHGLELVQYGGVFKFITKPFLREAIRETLALSKSRQLSQSALETLAIIAYKQPITRVEIEEIRGVGCDMMCRKLVALDLIQEAGRSDAIGRPILYEVTKTFLDDFKLVSLAELPELPDYSEGENENFFK